MLFASIDEPWHDDLAAIVVVRIDIGLTQRRGFQTYVVLIFYVQHKLQLHVAAREKSYSPSVQSTEVPIISPLALLSELR